MQTLPQLTGCWLETAGEDDCGMLTMELDYENHLRGFIRELLLISQAGNGFLGNIPVKSYKMKYFTCDSV